MTAPAQPLQTIITWRNNADGNGHFLYWKEERPLVWRPQLVVVKPCGTFQEVGCEYFFEATSQQLMDAGRSCGPAWLQSSESPGDDYKAERHMPIPGSKMSLCWKVHHNKVTGEMVLRDKLISEKIYR